MVFGHNLNSARRVDEYEASSASEWLHVAVVLQGRLAGRWARHCDAWRATKVDVPLAAKKFGMKKRRIDYKRNGTNIAELFWWIIQLKH